MILMHSYIHRMYTFGLTASVLASALLVTARMSAAPLMASHVNEVLFQKLGAYQVQSDGLYSLNQGILTVGGHSVSLSPIVESEAFLHERNIVAIRIDVAIDGAPKAEASFGTIGIAASQEEAVSVGLGEWYLSFAVPFFHATGKYPPSFSIADYDVFAGAMGLRGGTVLGWVDGTKEMGKKILEALLPKIHGHPGMVVLDLKIVVPATGELTSECRIDGEVSREVTSSLLALDWPRAADSYMFKLVLVLKRRE